MRKSPFLLGVALSASLLSSAVQARASDADRTFLIQDVQGGRYELALAKLATTKATKPAIKQYAQMIVRDHSRANQALMQLVKQEGVNLPAGMTDKDTKMLARLKTMSGSNFNRAFVDEMNRINAEDKRSADQEKASTKESAIRSYISRFSAMDAKHKSGASQLRQAVS